MREQKEKAREKKSEREKEKQTRRMRRKAKAKWKAGSKREEENGAINGETMEWKVGEESKRQREIHDGYHPINILQ